MWKQSSPGRGWCCAGRLPQPLQSSPGNVIHNKLSWQWPFSSRTQPLFQFQTYDRNFAAAINLQLCFKIGKSGKRDWSEFIHAHIHLHIQDIRLSFLILKHAIQVIRIQSYMPALVRSPKVPQSHAHKPLVSDTQTLKPFL